VEKGKTGSEIYSLLREKQKQTLSSIFCYLMQRQYYMNIFVYLTALFECLQEKIQTLKALILLLFNNFHFLKG